MATASEMLRELVADERWRSHDATVLAGLALNFNDVTGKGLLPLIADCIEGLERTTQHLDGHIGWESHELIGMNRAALIALVEHLEGGDVT